MTDILQAARSYYGLADTESCTTQLFTNQAGQTCVAFEIPLSNEDFAAIVQRMQNMQQPDTQPDTAIIEGPTVESMRESYNALSKAEKGRYGSFARYMPESCRATTINDMVGYKVTETRQPEGCETMDDVYHYRKMTPKSREVIHVDAPEEPEPVSMDAVWLSADDVSQAQSLHSVDYRIMEGGTKFEFLVQWAMLTDEQKRKAKP